jgi:predicted nucleotide-binding protein
MQYYHVLIEVDDEQRRETDLSRTDVESIVESYHNNQAILVDGCFVKPTEINRIKIFETEVESKKDPFFWSFVEKFSYDATKQFIKHSPRKNVNKIKNEKNIAMSKNIFIVHGRDHRPMIELKKILLEFGLNPIVLHEQPSGSKTIVEKLEKYSNVGYAFVILTPDDAGYCQYQKTVFSEDYTVKILPTLKKLRSLSKTEHEMNLAEIMKGFVGILRGRARQNVILEFGYFVGLLGRDKVCCLLKGDVEKPSDMQGIVYVPFKDSVNERRSMIIKELEAAGYEI